MTTLHDLHDLAAAVDADDLADRRAQARELDAGPPEPTQPCTCPHAVEDHWPTEGCVRRWCDCWWWAP